jgi:hypothetical protein
MALASDIHADIALKELFQGNVKVGEAQTDVPIYAENERPNIGLADDYIEIYNNGIITALTKPLGCFSGNLAVAICCKLLPDGAAATKRIKKLQRQIELLTQEKVSDGYYYEIDTTNVITPTTPNITTGYTTTIFNVSWSEI